MSLGTDDVYRKLSPLYGSARDYKWVGDVLSEKALLFAYDLLEMGYLKTFGDKLAFLDTRREKHLLVLLQPVEIPLIFDLTDYLVVNLAGRYYLYLANSA